jgi:hypothetical protein
MQLHKLRQQLNLMRHFLGIPAHLLPVTTDRSKKVGIQWISRK